MEERCLEKSNASERGSASMRRRATRDLRKSGRESGGNFAQDKERAAKAGRKGAETRIPDAQVEK